MYANFILQYHWLKQDFTVKVGNFIYKISLHEKGLKIC